MRLGKGGVKDMDPSVYLALDFPNWEETSRFLKTNQLQGVPVKVGMELFYREGIAVIEKLKGQNHPIFLDLKLHDIPMTVKRTMKNLASLEVDMVNMHALGGSEMIKYAKEGLLSANTRQGTKLLAVTLLTSMDQQVLNEELLLPGALTANAIHLANLAEKNGADGVVCSVHEAAQIKARSDFNFLTVTPGIRLKDTESEDQKRIATPSYARENGSDIIVIGRSVTKADNVKETYNRVIKEWNVHASKA